MSGDQYSINEKGACKLHTPAAVIIIFLGFCIGCFHPKAQNNNQINSFDIVDYIITSNFEKESFKVDTSNFIEGYAFYIKFFNDSSYFRVNDIAGGWATFECCKEDSIYKEINRTFEKGVSDRNGKVNVTNLYWREIKNEDLELEVVYNKCPKEKLKLFNKIMDSVYKKLLYNKK